MFIVIPEVWELLYAISAETIDGPFVVDGWRRMDENVHLRVHQGVNFLVQKDSRSQVVKNTVTVWCHWHSVGGSKYL